MTQQNLSQIENGRQTMSYDQRQRAGSVFGIASEDLGLSPGRPHAELYPAEHRVPDTPLIAGPGWIPDEPADLQSLRLTLDEQPQAVAIDGSEAETLPTRPLCAPDQPVRQI